MRQLEIVVRRLLRAPGFTAVALLTLAIGVGANTAVFTVLHSVLIRPLPYAEPERLVSLWFSAPGLDWTLDGDLNCNPTIYETFTEQNETFSSLALWSRAGATLTIGGESDGVPMVRVTYGLFDTLGVQPATGRWFSEADDQPGAPPAAVLDHGYWQRRFGADPGVVGQTLTVDEQVTEIIGVAPAGFRVLDAPASLYVPHQFDREFLFLGNFSHHCVARLRPGVTEAQASADVARMLPIWLSSWPPPPGFSAGLFDSARFGPSLHHLKDDVVGDLGNLLWVLMGTVGLVLVIACANVANLLLVRAEGRHHELAIRSALGAGWGRIARDLLSESVVLGLAGGVIGVGFAELAIRGLVAAAPDGLPRLTEIGIDATVLVFALLISLVAGLLFGLLPVLRHSGAALATALRGTGRSASASRERHRARNTLVVVQVALALVLLVAAGLMIRTVQQLRSVDPGFTEPAQILTMRLAVRQSQAEDGEPVLRLMQRVKEAVAAVPGVHGVAFTNSAPMQGFNSNDVLFIEGQDLGDIPPVRRYRFVSPDSFDVLGTRLVSGRDLTWDDLFDTRAVAVVSEGMADEVWGGPRAALGKRVRWDPNGPWREVVGVVADVRDDGVRQPPPTTIYWPAMMADFWGSEIYAQRGYTLLVRSDRVGQAGFIQTVQDLADRSMARTSFTVVVLSIAGGMALLLGLIGIYGVMAYSVTQRVKEIGIRMALGAGHTTVRRMFIRHGVGLAAVGVLVGGLAAAGLSRVMSTLLFGVTGTDPLTYVFVAVLLAGAAALASYLPARRATGVDPMSVLRAD